MSADRIPYEVVAAVIATCGIVLGGIAIARLVAFGQPDFVTWLTIALGGFCAFGGWGLLFACQEER